MCQICTIFIGSSFENVGISLSVDSCFSKPKSKLFSAFLLGFRWQVSSDQHVVPGRELQEGSLLSEVHKHVAKGRCLKTSMALVYQSKKHFINTKGIAYRALTLSWQACKKSFLVAARAYFCLVTWYSRSPISHSQTTEWQSRNWDEKGIIEWCYNSPSSKFPCITIWNRSYSLPSVHFRHRYSRLLLKMAPFFILKFWDVKSPLLYLGREGKQHFSCTATVKSTLFFFFMVHLGVKVTLILMILSGNFLVIHSLACLGRTVLEQAAIWTFL